MNTMKYVTLLLMIVCSLSVKATEKPNILWIYVEDLSPWMETYGYNVNAGQTPNLTKMSESGVQFSRCYMPAPVCSACRSALITGVYQTTTGFHNHRSSRTADSMIKIPDGIKTLPQLFLENGYATFNKGKDDYNFSYKRSEHYSVAKKDASARGFTQKGTASWGNMPKGRPWFGQIQLKGGKAKTNKVKNKVDPTKMKVPAYFPDENIFRKEWAHHYDTVRFTDNDVKNIMDNLKKDGLLANTIVFFFSDHGNDHSLRHKQFCYEGGVHVPLIISGPGIVRGKVRNELVSGLDISATTLALAGIDIPDYIDGKDLFTEAYQKRDHVISARDRCDYSIDRIRTVRTDKYRYIKNFMTDRILLQPQYRDHLKPTIRLREMHKNGKLGKIPEWAFFGKRPAEELYDMEKDPHQIDNLAKDSAFTEELIKHRELLHAWIKATGDKGAIPESQDQLRAVYKRWGDKCVNPEFDKIKLEK